MDSLHSGLLKHSLIPGASSLANAGVITTAPTPPKGMNIGSGLKPMVRPLSDIKPPPQSLSAAPVSGVVGFSADKLVKLYSGDYYITNDPNEVITTVLGSCISCCARDPVVRVGGMNHFLLPTSGSNISIDHDDAARYGAYAMEKLINSLLLKGASRISLEIKLFGGADVSSTSALIGTKNVEFIRKYIKDENFHVVSEHLGGTAPRRINYYPITGRVMMKLVEQAEQNDVIQQEIKYQSKIKTETSAGGDVELF